MRTVDRETQSITALEEGALKKEIYMPLQANLALSVRRLTWKGREYVDIRFVSGIYGSLQYTKKGIRIRIEHLDKLITALNKMTEKEKWE